MSQHSPIAFDLLIAGGGATGLALALMLLKNTDLRIGMIEAGEAPCVDKNDVSAADFLELRSIALSAQSCDLLSELGLDALDDIANPIHTIHVSDKGHLGQCTLQADDYHMDALGRVVELSELVTKLHERINLYSDQLQIFYQTEISEVARSQSKVTVTLSGGENLIAQLLVVAEGGQSQTRQKLGIEVTHQNYQQTALVANVELAEHHKNCAFERFTEQGPLALLPLKSTSQTKQNYRCAIVWTLSHERYQQLMEKTDGDFIKALQSEFGYRLGLIKRVGPRSGYPLALTVAQQHIHHRAVLMGNACQSLHPIAGQGLNLALRDVKQLADTLVNNQRNDIGQYSILRDYQQSRVFDQQRLTVATDTLVRTFSNRHLPLVIGRNLALTLLDIMPSLKQTFAMTAMGYNKKTGYRHAKL